MRYSWGREELGGFERGKEGKGGKVRGVCDPALTELSLAVYISKHILEGHNILYLKMSEGKTIGQHIQGMVNSVKEVFTETTNTTSEKLDQTKNAASEKATEAKH